MDEFNQASLHESRFLGDVKYEDTTGFSRVEFQFLRYYLIQDFLDAGW